MRHDERGGRRTAGTAVGADAAAGVAERVRAAAERARAEAALRRAAADSAADVEPSRPREIGGVDGPEPARYGDWDVKGRLTDF